MQQIDISLDSIGYIYSRQLLDFNSQQSTFNLDSVCHYYDILVNDPNESSEKTSKLFQQFNQVITSPSILHYHTPPTISLKRDYVKNDERRQYLLDEFIMTEANYLSSLRTFINLIVEPLRQKSKDRQRAIIGQYECANIFMNIDELAAVTQDFYNDLIQHGAGGKNLGDLCLSHMRRFTCYNRFLLGVHNAQIINEKQLKNPNYYHFLEKVINNQSNGNQTVYDYLALPSQRVGRYTMYFKELIKHTTDDHVDLPGLHASLLKAEEIANMTEEIHTQIMKIFRRLLQAVQYCPESLISFQRRFLCYLDVTEIDQQTMKPVQPVTLFLFSDKIMVVKRPSYESDGLDLCGLDQRMYEGSERKDFCIRKEAVTGKMKFIGWASLNDIDIHDGPDPSFSKTSFTLLCNSSGPLPSSTDTDQATQKSLEAYFQHDQQKHSFFLNEGGNMINREYFQTAEKTRAHFIHQFGKAKNSLKQSDQLIQTSYCQWNHHHFFANIYPTSMYDKVSNKNEIALFYIEKNTVNIETVLSRCLVIPNMVGFIVPHEKDDSYR
ncbi:Dbl homology domain-containing protein [Mucor mucedo]|uniref:Dbl homology domain-containing protein n=1 Tax=Mucor mucedo TaxID=29922 RepID=UPI0022207053|nr:Dbl homology domain-containing protein [Mucor mucedo]KAI7892911.1 Dbl homology domain-containing protein [Mucor mucedo]